MRITRDLALAEDLAHDALVAALEQWPASGVPDNPGAWLTAAAKRRAIDAWRARPDAGSQARGNRHDMAAREAAIQDPADALDDDVGDDLLRLMFTACHPVLAAEARVALTLRLLGGLTTEEIARAFLVSEPTIAQRIVRAKRALATARVPFEVPGPADRGTRMASILEVIYLIFNEGYAATRGDDWMRPALCEEALRLGRVLAGLAAAEAEVHGLVALLEIQSSRSRARVGRAGEPILLLDQNRALLGSAADPARPRGAGARRGARADAGPTPCRPRSRRATRGRSPPTPPTGRASSISMASWRRLHRRRSSS
jgi:RNA polymerase sigma factor (sigma-70 family)